MRILSPIDRLDEVGPLVDAGVDELYGGFVPGAWLGRYSIMGSTNQRFFPGAQIKTEPELARLISDAHRRGARFYLVMNSQFYTGPQYGELLDQARRVHALGADGFIVSDIGLILRLRDAMPDAELHLSTLGTVFNGRSAAFFAGLGVKRMVFPRELTVAEMAGIVKANPGCEFDAFVLIGKCPNIEGYCGFTHNSPELVWPCEEAYRVEAVKGVNGVDGIINAQMGWSRINRRQACGLCAVSGLAGAGVTALKLVGRGGPTAMKVKVAGAVRRMLDLAENAPSGHETHAAARELYREIFGRGCNPYICYFPEVWRREG
ncbi:MAG: U32 family peptidase [Nitrospirae bacterium]|nr:U32 family peptidase [Nitrospirota bacterium]